jgi:serine/threonine protein phosphatase PrpC/predicted Ser/Thr protein kinase/ribosomal protein L39E
MPSQLQISLGQYSDKGRKEINQDFHGACIPLEPQLSSKGIAIALADGISGSDVSHIASASAVRGFLEDYLCTSEAWSVKTSVQRVLTATNSWLYAQTRHSQHRYDTGKGYVCTLSALVIKSATAHVFHVGDSRVYRLRGKTLEQLTNDHQMRVGEDTTYLARALGMNPHLEIDYQALTVDIGDIFILVTDGVYEYSSPKFVINTIQEQGCDLDAAARVIAAEALRRGSSDNLTIQIARIDGLPTRDADEIHQQLTGLPFAPPLEARMTFDGYRIVRTLHVSARSHVYLAQDEASQAMVAIKTPSIEQRGDAAYLERFLMEEWIARRINSPHVLKPSPPARQRNFLYVATEYVEGQTLTQWMIDNPKPALETARGIIEQIARGLQAFHRMEMLHQDLRPQNILIDGTGTVKIIDFGSARVAGLEENAALHERAPPPGTVQYMAPEYFLGEAGTTRSDIFSLGVIAYQMLSGKLPYGADAAMAKTRAAQRKLRYQSLLDDHREIPAWIDVVLRKAVRPDPYQRYDELSEFVYDLRHPNAALLNQKAPPLLERNPLLFWKCACLVLTLVIVAMAFR